MQFSRFGLFFLSFFLLLIIARRKPAARVWVVHNPRSCNMVAHSLAVLSPGADPIQDSIPSCIRLLVAKDLLVFVYWLPKI